MISISRRSCRTVKKFSLKNLYATRRPSSASLRIRYRNPEVPGSEALEGIKMIARHSAAAAALGLGLALVAAPASAALVQYHAHLTPLNPMVNSGVSGTAHFTHDTTA